jgi:integrase
MLAVEFGSCTASFPTGRTRVVPVGQRLRAVLAIRRHGPDGMPLGPDAYVFGNEVGERVGDVKTAWQATCRRAGIIGLHFHDLRREFACALLESGAALHDVRDFLGHTDITTMVKERQSSPIDIVAVLATVSTHISPSRKSKAPLRSAPSAS